MKRVRLMLLVVVGSVAVAIAQNGPAWPQWGQNPQHTGNLPVTGQPPQAKLTDQTFDPFVRQEIAESGALLTHYQAPLVNGNNVFMEFKSGKYISCQPPGRGSRSLAGRMHGIQKSGTRPHYIGRTEN
jgi:hypothetical protein